MKGRSSFSLRDKVRHGQEAAGSRQDQAARAGAGRVGYFFRRHPSLCSPLICSASPEQGNPGGLPGLYSGTVAEFTKADTVIFRSDLYNVTTGQKIHHFKRTIKYDAKWLDKPHFVGSFDVGDWVFFFFRESAVEYINCGKNIYSRVARVCKVRI